jgi:non-specific serine/threonine protein kinase
VSTLEPETVQALRNALLAARHAGDARQMRLSPALALSTSLRDGAAVSIDFGVVRVLGHPLVVLHRAQAQPGAADRFDSLSKREREVAECIASGMTNSRIAARLCISRPTVKDHVHSILTKTALANRTEIAAAWYAQSV